MIGYRTNYYVLFTRSDLNIKSGNVSNLWSFPMVSVILRVSTPGTLNDSNTPWGGDSINTYSLSDF